MSSSRSQSAAASISSSGCARKEASTPSKSLLCASAIRPLEGAPVTTRDNSRLPRRDGRTCDATKEVAAMTEPTVGTREEYTAAREKLLAREKELTHLSDELARERRELPWVPLDKEY